MRKKTKSVLKTASATAMAFGLLVTSIIPADVYAAEVNEEITADTVQEVHAQTGTKEPYKEGDDIRGSVFYIAVDADGNGKVTDEGDGIYYYTLDEIKNKNEEVPFYYGNHGEGETANVIGAKLSTLIEDMNGTVIGNDWIIQYMEEDAFHATNAEYQDTVGSLTDENGVGNGSGAGIATETMIGWANKLIYDKPDANNVNDTDYVPFTDYDREPSFVRAYRQTNSANSSVLKLLKGVVITNKQEGIDLPSGKCGYQLCSVDAAGNKIADDYEALGLLEGMKWLPTPNVDVPWANVTSDAHETVTIGSDASQEVAFTYEETPFFEWTVDGTQYSLKRSELAAGGIEYPESNVFNGVSYTYFGYNKPMYERYQGKHLKDILGDLTGKNVYIVKQDGSRVDITQKVDDIFTAYYYTQSKKSTNISNAKRVPLNFDHSVLIDVTTADLEYSNGDEDYEVVSGKTPEKYENAYVQVETAKAAAPKPAQVTGVTASLSKYNSAKIAWSKVASADKYIVEYKTASARTWKSKTTTARSITIGSLTAGKNYQFRVRACIGAEKSAKYSAVKTVTTLKAVKVIAKRKNSRAVLSFNNIAGESGYEVSQKTGTRAWKTVKTLKANKVSWTSSKLAKKKVYRYRVRAYKTVNGKKIYAPWSPIVKVTGK